MGLIESIGDAIATMEGFYKSGSISQRLNNPGNLRSWGSYPIVDGYVQFPDAATGWQALYDQINKNIGRGLNLVEFFSGKPGVYGGYSPAADKNDPRGYAQYVAGQLGVSPQVPLNSIGDFSGNPLRAPKYNRQTSGRRKVPESARVQ